MTGKNARQNGFLRLVSGDGVTTGAERKYPLMIADEMVIGRDPSCHIILDAVMYRMVSRRHAVVRPSPPSPEGEHRWLICDMSSANGTYLNGKPLKGCQELVPGDRITLGSNGAEFVFECEINYQPTMLPPASGAAPVTTVVRQNLTQGQDSVSFTQLFPIISTGKDLTRKAYLIPGILTVIFVVL
ncbi:MAG: FHA domain-containing protein, partial [Sphaerospermopsis sp.]|nr:FHA domain-containing protein [Sphaerospermopsis sp.]